jgi:predicted metal-dependent phosphoesterase TrpH
MHIHSHFSLDAFASIDSLLKRAKNAEIGLAITDHNTIAGSLKAQEQKDVLIIPGIEVTTREGIHVLGYFHTQERQERFFEQIIAKHHRLTPFAIDLTLRQFLPLARPLVDLLVAAHPFKATEGGIQKFHENNAPEILDHLDAVEALNSMTPRELNERAATWAEQIQKPATGASDGHFSWQAALAITAARGTTPEALLTSIKNGEALAVGREEPHWRRYPVKVLKELRLLARPSGFHILSNQFARRFKWISQS